jgi:hypothetical protein
VREEFMKPLGVTVEELKAGIPQSCPRPVELRTYLTWLLAEGPRFAVGPDQILFVDVSLVLDRAFDCPAGYFMKRWSRCAIQCRARRNRRWLSKIQPVSSGRGAEKHSNLTPHVEAWMVDAVHEIDHFLGLPRFDSALQDAVMLLARNYWHEESARPCVARPCLVHTSVSRRLDQERSVFSP